MTTGFTDVKAVLFDLDGTLYRQPVVRAAMALELASIFALPGRAEPASLVVRGLRAYRHAHEAMRREGVVRDVARLQLERAATDAGADVMTMRRLVTEWMHERPLKYLKFARRPGVERLLRALKERGLLVGVLSDYEPHAKLEAMGLLPHFGLILCTTDPQIDALKPSPRGFLHACAEWGLSPADVLYVGDRPDVDGIGARAAGVRCAIVGWPGGPAREGLHRVAGFGALGRALARG